MSRRRSRTVLSVLLVVALFGASLAGVFVLGRSAANRPAPTFERITFRRGRVTGARFAPDGRTVVYSAAWDGAPPAVYSLRLDALSPVPSGYPGAHLLAISAKSQLALTLERSIAHPTLALAPFAGGTPRELEADVGSADFSRGGETLAITRGTAGDMRLEYPPGTVLYSSRSSHPYGLRISASGKYLAFAEATRPGTSSGDLVVIDRSGTTVLRKGLFARLDGLAWSPRQDEVWLGSERGLRAVALDGRERDLLGTPVPMTLHDVAPDGRVLADTIEHRLRVFYRSDAASPDRELSVQGDSIVGALSSDGTMVALTDDSIGGVEQCYLRSASGDPPIELGEGWPASFSPDGRTLLVVRREVPAVVLHPVGPGGPRTIRFDGLEAGTLSRKAGFLPGDSEIWISGNQPSRPPRIWAVAVPGGQPRPLTPEGVSGWVTHDGASVVFSRDSRQWIQPIAGGEARQVEGLLEGETVAVWTADGRPVFVYRTRDCPTKVFRLDPKTGQREPFREIGPADATGVRGVYLQMTPDGKTCTYSVFQELTELYLIEGLR